MKVEFGGYRRDEPAKSNGTKRHKEKSEAGKEIVEHKKEREKVV